MKLPPRLPVKGSFAMLYEHINQLRDYLASLTPLQSHRMRTTHTTIGVAREPDSSAGKNTPGSGTTPKWG